MILLFVSRLKKFEKSSAALLQSCGAAGLGGLTARGQRERQAGTGQDWELLREGENLVRHFICIHSCHA